MSLYEATKRAAFGFYYEKPNANDGLKPFQISDLFLLTVELRFQTIVVVENLEETS